MSSHRLRDRQRAAREQEFNREEREGRAALQDRRAATALVTIWNAGQPPAGSYGSIRRSPPWRRRTSTRISLPLAPGQDLQSVRQGCLVPGIDPSVVRATAGDVKAIFLDSVGYQHFDVSIQRRQAAAFPESPLVAHDARL
jgi:hypothetical protein